METTILVVDDDRVTRESLAMAGRSEGFNVRLASSGREAVDEFRRAPADVILTDVVMDEGSGLDLLDAVMDMAPETVVIMMTGYGTVETAVEAMRKGAYDYLTKPVDLDHLLLVIQKALEKHKLQAENRMLKAQLQDRFKASNIIGRSARIQAVFAQLEKIAPTNATVLVTGESGTGKEMFAGAIHFNSQRADGPFVKVNCMALAEGVMESELFGHERGAFTGALRQRKGRFEQAHGGSLFLDEVGDLNMPLQLKLLRVLQEREVERVGSNKVIPVDVRLICATNRDLRAEVDAGRFREELFYRIHVVTVQVPPLRERAEDIPLLSDHFIHQFNREHGKAVKGLSQAALKAMVAYQWPGNVRELRNTIESLVVMSRGPVLDVADLPSAMRQEDAEGEILVRVGTPLEDVERTVILRTLQAAGSNKTRAAEILGIGLKTLYRRLEEYGYPKPEGDADESTEDQT